MKSREEGGGEGIRSLGQILVGATYVYVILLYYFIYDSDMNFIHFAHS